MFKGQGANQAIGDGPLLASWLCRPGLTRNNLSTRLKCFEQEMISKTSPKVVASRVAAQYLHSSECMKECIGIEGVPNDQIQLVLDALDLGSVRADHGPLLDETIKSIISAVGKKEE
jgi:hypothetical protein